MPRSRPTSQRNTTAACSRAGLPVERAFVVQLRADADLARGIVCGRIEHVLSGTAERFDSLEQLIGCMRDVVARCAAARTTDSAST